jgi:hypothetical protein
VVERGPFKSEVEGSIPSALTICQISVLDTHAPSFYFPIFICHLFVESCLIDQYVNNNITLC